MLPSLCKHTRTHRRTRTHIPTLHTQPAGIPLPCFSIILTHPLPSHLNSFLLSSSSPLGPGAIHYYLIGIALYLLPVARGSCWREAGHLDAQSPCRGEGPQEGRQASTQHLLFSLHRKPKETSITLTRTLPGKSRSLRLWTKR